MDLRKFVCAGAILAVTASLSWAQSTTSLKQLTVERIYSQPSLSGRLYSGLAWTPDGKWLTYLETKGRGKDARKELWSISATTGERKLLVSAEKLESALSEDKSKPTQATGLGRRAPAEYRWAPNGSAILFVGPNSLAWYDLKTEKSQGLLSGKAAIADAKISPDGKWVSFVREHNLFAVSTMDAKEHALTTGGTEEIRKGELDWVYPEELAISTAYWWAPDSSAIAFLEMDERKVTKYPMVDFASYSGEADEEQYPVAGGNNPVVHVYVVAAGGGKARLMDTGAETNNYIPRVQWFTDSKRVAIERLNRKQNQLDLLAAEAGTGKSATIFTDTDDYWVNVSDDLYFFKDGKRFLWSSERTGYRHLYLYDLSGKQLAQLTKGEWEVSKLEAVDEAKGIAYFTATEKSPLERHLYRVNLDGSGFSRITKEDGVHGINISPDAAAFADTYSRAGTPAQQFLLRTDGSSIATLNENQVPELADYHLSPMEFLKVKAHDGAELNAWMIKPPNFDPSKKYPVLTYTYGGPGVQIVMNSWSGATFLWHQMMAQKGFIIFALDNRGSTGRGHVFEEPIRMRLGAQELSDQKDGAAWLKMQPYVDADHIGIWGWSYGGHMTLHLMFEDSEDFKAGFAGGPVTNWHFYDSIYTERYMGLPQENEKSYQDSSPSEKAGQLRGPLLIAHGTGDDNVHFANTLKLVDELIAKGKYVEVMAFPGRGHGVSDPPARVVLMNRVTKFFLDNLMTHAN
ncbi:MAG TPA: DPP IV N-terminal domain-containing protein [Candidatus Dormibacteraeota bacterium]|jgi:dipeptidyl-peptidase-4|nr:DPP IV N-terminal domain-containing protein [Candidatus Dormibacteraeota bacterium]